MRKKTGVKMPMHMIGGHLAAGAVPHAQAHPSASAAVNNGAACYSRRQTARRLQRIFKGNSIREREQASPVLSQEAEACGSLWEASGVEAV